MMKRVCFFALFFALLMGSTGALGADFPAKTVKLIVPFSAGGGTDAVARSLASVTEKYLGKPVTVINKTGGSGAVGMTEGAMSKKDGYTVTMVTREIAWLYQMGLAQVKPSDFDAIALVNEDPAVVLVASDSKYDSVEALVSAAREDSGKVRFGSTAKPNFYLLALELNQHVTFNQIPYNGAAETIPAVMGGHVDFTMVNPGEAISQIEAGQLKALGVCSDKRLGGLPEVPTMTEQGYPIVTGTWRGLAVPQGTPKALREVLEQAFTKAIEDPGFQDFMNKRKLGIRHMNAENFARFMDKDAENLTDVVEAIKKQQQ